MHPKNWIFIVGALLLFLGPKDLWPQEIPEVQGIEINVAEEPWKQAEATPGPRDFGPKDLSQLLEELLVHNPQLRAVVEKIKSLENLVDPAGALEDPRFSFEGSNIPYSPPALNRTPMTGLQIYFRQKVPWPGKLKLKKKIARSQAEQEMRGYYEQLNQLVAKFKKTYFDYRMVSELVSIYGATTARLGGLEKVLEARYSAGDSPQQDILKNKVEISVIGETVVELKQRKKILLARMNTWLNRPEEQKLKLKPSREPRSRLEAPLTRLLDLAQRNRPWLEKTALEIQEADFQHKLAKKSLLPDFDFGVGWRFRQASPGGPVLGEDFFSAGFTINLPAYAGKKQKKQIAAAYYQKRSKEYLRQATLQEVRYQVEQIFHQLNSFQSQLGILNRRTLPQSKAAVKSSRVNYEADEIDFLNVLTNEVALLNQRLKQAKYYYGYEMKIAELEMATGLPIHLLNQPKPQQGADHEKF